MNIGFQNIDIAFFIGYSLFLLVFVGVAVYLIKKRGFAEKRLLLIAIILGIALKFVTIPFTAYPWAVKHKTDSKKYWSKIFRLDGLGLLVGYGVSVWEINPLPTSESIEQVIPSKTEVAQASWNYSITYVYGFGLSYPIWSTLSKIEYPTSTNFFHDKYRFRNVVAVKLWFLIIIILTLWVFQRAFRKHHSDLFARKFLALWLLNPVIIHATDIYMHMETLMLLVLAACVYFSMDRKLLLTSVLLGIGVSIKANMLFIAVPLLVLSERKIGRNILYLSIMAATTVAIVSITNNPIEYFRTISNYAHHSGFNMPEKAFPIFIARKYLWLLIGGIFLLYCKFVLKVEDRENLLIYTSLVALPWINATYIWLYYLAIISPFIMYLYCRKIISIRMLIIYYVIFAFLTYKNTAGFLLSVDNFWIISPEKIDHVLNPITKALEFLDARIFFGCFRYLTRFAHDIAILIISLKTLSYIRSNRMTPVSENPPNPLFQRGHRSFPL